MTADPTRNIPLPSIHASASGDRPADPGLVESVKQSGLLQPIALVADGDGFRVVYGSRRVDACRKAGFETVPAIVYHDLDASDERILCLVENCQREGQTPLAEGRLFAELVNLGLSHAEVARRIGKPREYVSNRVRLASMPPAALRVLEGIPYNLTAVLVLSRLPADRLVSVLDESPGCAADVELAKDALRSAGRDLSGTPFETGGCKTCGKRDADLCLDVTCYNEKLSAHVAAGINAIRRKHPTAPVLVSKEGVRRASAETVNLFSVHGAGSLRRRRLAEEGEGGEPVILLDGADPKLVRVVPAAPSTDGRSTRYSPDGQESLDVRRRLQDALSAPPRTVRDNELAKLCKALAGALAGRDNLSATDAYNILFRTVAPALARRLQSPPPDSDRAADFRRINIILQ